MTYRQLVQSALLVRRGIAHLTRSQSTGDLVALDRATKRLRKALAVLQPVEVDVREEPEATIRRLLGDCLRLTYQATGKLGLLQEAVHHLRCAETLTREGSHHRSLVENNLGYALRLHYQATGEEAAGREAVDLIRRAVNDPFCSAQARAVRLGNLGETLLARYQIGGERALLAEAVELLRRSFEMTPRQDPSYGEAAAPLSLALTERWRQQGDSADLTEATRLARVAAEADPRGEPGSLAILGHLLIYNFEENGQPATLEEAIAVLRRAERVEWASSEAAAGRSALARALTHRYEVTGDREALEESLHLLETARAGTPENAPARVALLGNLGRVLRLHYDVTGDRATLDRCLRTCRTAIEQSQSLLVNPRPSEQVPGRVPGKAAGALDSGAIGGDENAAGRRPQGPQPGNGGLPTGSQSEDTERNLWLSNYSQGLQREYELTGSEAAIREAVEMGRRAVDATAITHPDRRYLLMTLAWALQSLAERTADQSFLVEAADRADQATRLVAPGNPARSAAFSVLSVVLLRLSGSNRSLEDCDRAIQAARQAIEESTTGTSDRAYGLANLGSALRWRHELTSDTDDLRSAVEACRDAVQAAGRSSAMASAMVANLAATLDALLQSQPSAALHQELLDAAEQGTTEVTAAPIDRVVSGRLWAAAAVQDGNLDLAFRAYRLTMEQLPRLTSRALARADQEFWLRRTQTPACDAAGVAMMQSDAPTALQWLEQGRAVMWSQRLDHTRSELTALRQADPHLADRLASVNTRLTGTGPTVQGSRPR